MRLLLFLLFFVQFSVNAQCDTATLVDFPDVEAKFPGGVIEMKKFIVENMELPNDSMCSMGLTGRVYLSFMVCSDGSIHTIHIKRSHQNIDLEQIAISVIKKMPDWIPAELKNQAVSTNIILPITVCYF